MEYTKEQKQAIAHDKGPFLCLAAPGSGKTSVITERTRYLIEQYGIHPGQILVITFTRAAANEMKARFETLMGGAHTAATFGTFHSVFFWILKQAYHYTPANIIKEETKYQYIRELVQKEDLDLSDEADFIQEILAEISLVKGEMMEVSNYYSTSCSDDVFRRIYEGYCRRCQQANLIDFDDMQSYCYTLLKERPDILAMWQKKFRYILIDEFQDINQLQYEIVKMLARPEDNLFIVGDDDQSIYRFRGARPEIMLHFTDDYPNAKKVLLGVNYRSSEEIMAAAGRVIINNKERYEKEVVANSGSGEEVSVLRFDTQKQEHLDLIEKIKQYNAAGMLYKDMAVLFRTNLQPRMLTERLHQYNIPFCMKDGMFNLYDHWICVNILNYIRMGLGDMRRSLFLTVMNRPNRYISRDLLDQDIVDFERLKMKVANRDWMVERLENFAGQISLLKKMAPYAAVNYIRKGIGYDDYIREYAKERRMNEEELFDILEEVQESAKEYRTYEDWFLHMQEYKEQLKASRHLTDKEDAVVLSTMHQSKGLEYDAVFIMDACEGITPHKKAVKEEEIEEERRMFYVAMTRAKQHLTIYVVNKIFNKTATASRFVSELEYDRRCFTVGRDVTHKIYGEGTITYADAKRVSIYFKESGETKTFHLAYALENGYLALS